MNEVLSQARALFREESQWPFTQDLVKTVTKHLPRIDSAISPHARDWPLPRMAAVDRTVLRLAVAEMMFFPDIPFQVTINEAVELAKKYGDVDSGSFVNGILSSVHTDQAAAAKL